MAANPFDHVMDSKRFEFFESLHWEFTLPKFHLPLYGDFQITKFMILEVVAAALILIIYVPLARRAQSGELPKGFFWNTFESMLTFFRERVVKPNVGEHDADRFMPFIWTFFLFILFCNLLGMFPYMGSPTASISVTGVLAVSAFLLIHGGAVAKLGFQGYLKSYVPHIEAAWYIAAPITLMIIPIEAFGHLIKTFVLAVRLFANLFAGHTVLAVILLFIVMAKDTAFYLFWPITLGSVVGVATLSLLEIFVAFLQAYVFAFLTSLFLGMMLHPQH
jgi:F-type H+-transporting ATPase subunit a